VLPPHEQTEIAFLSQASPPSRPVFVVTHLPDPELALRDEVLPGRGLSYVHTSMVNDGPLPDVGDTSAIVSLGGQMSVTGISHQPFLRDELRLMRAALTSNTPVFGL
jgi:GMP synthase-like glutamine amidotransferase